MTFVLVEQSRGAGLLKSTVFGSIFQKFDKKSTLIDLIENVLKSTQHLLERIIETFFEFFFEFFFSGTEKFSKPKKYFLLKSTQNLLKRIGNHFNIFSFQINSESSKNIDFLLLKVQIFKF